VQHILNLTLFIIASMFISSSAFHILITINSRSICIYWTGTATWVSTQIFLWCINIYSMPKMTNIIYR